MDYKKNRLYFKPNSIKGLIVLTVFGLIAVILGIIFCSIRIESIGIINIVFGAGMILGGVIPMFSKVNSKKISDNYMDNEINTEVTKTLEMIPDRMGINPEEVNYIEPIQVLQNYYNDIKSPGFIKTGKDGKIRSSNYEVIRILFSETELYCFKRQFSLISEEQYIETKEYRYSDIISISTETVDESKIRRNFVGESCTITTSGGSSFTASRVVTNRDNPENSKELKMFEESVRGMKQLWREKNISAGI